MTPSPTPPAVPQQADTAGVVIAVNDGEGVFALESPTGICGVFWMVAGPRVQVHDTLQGNVACRGHCTFMHRDGVVEATGTGPVTRSRALHTVAG